MARSLGHTQIQTWQTYCLLLLFIGVISLPSTAQALEHSEPKTSAVAWNRAARDLVRSSGLSAPRAARVYAYMSVAQHQALIAIHRDVRWQTGVILDQQLSRRALSAASKGVLEDFFPNHTRLLSEIHRTYIEARSSPVEPAAGAAQVLADALGRIVANSVLRRLHNDGR